MTLNRNKRTMETTSLKIEFERVQNRNLATFRWHGVEIYFHGPSPQCVRHRFSHPSVSDNASRNAWQAGRRKFYLSNRDPKKKWFAQFLNCRFDQFAWFDTLLPFFLGTRKLRSNLSQPPCPELERIRENCTDTPSFHLSCSLSRSRALALSLSSSLTLALSCSFSLALARSLSLSLYIYISYSRAFSLSLVSLAHTLSLPISISRDAACPLYVLRSSTYLPKRGWQSDVPP